MKCLFGLMMLVSFGSPVFAWIPDLKITAINISCQANGRSTALGVAVINKYQDGASTEKNGTALAFVSLKIAGREEQMFKASYVPMQKFQSLINDNEKEEMSLKGDGGKYDPSEDYVRTSDGFIGLGHCNFTQFHDAGTNVE